MTEFLTLLGKELLRFWKVGFQTVCAPVLTALLYLMIFSQVLDNHVQVHGVRYTAFLVPGLIMMSVLQNAFANSSSSLIQSKITGNLVFVLLTPISNFQFFVAYLAAATIRGMVVGLGVLLATCWIGGLSIAEPLWILLFTLLGGALMGALGLIAGMWAEKFDQLAAFQNFLILPLTMLSGVFYSVQSLPEFWQTVSRVNPMFYLIDGFRYGFFAASDASPWLSLGVASVFMAVIGLLSYILLVRGYKLRT